MDAPTGSSLLWELSDDLFDLSCPDFLSLMQLGPHLIPSTESRLTPIESSGGDLGLETLTADPPPAESDLSTPSTADSQFDRDNFLNSDEGNSIPSEGVSPTEGPQSPKRRRLAVPSIEPMADILERGHQIRTRQRLEIIIMGGPVQSAATNVESGESRYFPSHALFNFQCVYNTPDDPCDVCYKKGLVCGRNDKVWGEGRRRGGLDVSGRQDPPTTSMDIGHFVQHIPHPPSIPDDLECSADDALYLNQLLHQFEGEKWWCIHLVRLVFPYSDHHGRSQLVHHTLLAVAYIEAITFQCDTLSAPGTHGWFFRRPDYDHHFTEFASQKAPEVYESWVRHLGHSYRLVREAINRENYFDAMLGSLLLAQGSFRLGRYEESHVHAQALLRCASKMFERKSEDTAGFLKAAADCIMYSVCGIFRYIETFGEFKNLPDDVGPTSSSRT